MNDRKAPARQQIVDYWEKEKGETFRRDRCWRCRSECVPHKCHIKAHVTHKELVSDPSNYVLLCSYCHDVMPLCEDTDFVFEWCSQCYEVVVRIMALIGPLPWPPDTFEAFYPGISPSRAAEQLASIQTARLPGDWALTLSKEYEDDSDRMKKDMGEIMPVSPHPGLHDGHCGWIIRKLLEKIEAA